LEIKKEKLSGKKLRDVILDYDKWYWKFNLRKTIDPDRSILAQDIENHCHWEMENKTKDKQGKTTYYIHTNMLSPWFRNKIISICCVH